MENNENSSGEVNESKKSVTAESKVKKLKIKRFRRKDGEKKKKRDPSQPKHPLTGESFILNNCNFATDASPLIRVPIETQVIFGI